MKVVRCINGHFYDYDTYMNNCPHCQQDYNNIIYNNNFNSNNINSVKTGKIKGIAGAHKNMCFEIEDGQTIIIGRDSDKCKIVIKQDNEKVSRVHCRIKYDAAKNSFTVTDMSKNGTYLHHRRLDYNIPTPADMGTEIQLADSTNIFRLG